MSTPTQTMLVKRRKEPRTLAASLRPVGLRAPRSTSAASVRLKPPIDGSRAAHPTAAPKPPSASLAYEQPQHPQLGLDSATSHHQRGRTRRVVTVEEALDRCLREGYTPDVIGRAVIALLDQPNGLTLSAVFLGSLDSARPRSA